MSRYQVILDTMAPYVGLPWAQLPHPRPCLRLTTLTQTTPPETPPVNPMSPFVDRDAQPPTMTRMHLMVAGMHTTLQGHVIQHALVFAAHVQDQLPHQPTSHQPIPSRPLCISMEARGCCVYLPRQPLTEDVLAWSMSDMRAVWPASTALHHRIQHALHQGDSTQRGLTDMPSMDGAAIHALLRDGQASEEGIVVHVSALDGQHDGSSAQGGCSSAPRAKHHVLSCVVCVV